MSRLQCNQELLSERLQPAGAALVSVDTKAHVMPPVAPDKENEVEVAALVCVSNNCKAQTTHGTRDADVTVFERRHTSRRCPSCSAVIVKPP